MLFKIHQHLLRFLKTTIRFAVFYDSTKIIQDTLRLQNPQHSGYIWNAYETSIKISGKLKVLVMWQILELTFRNQNNGRSIALLTAVQWAIAEIPMHFRRNSGMFHSNFANKLLPTEEWNLQRWLSPLNIWISGAYSSTGLVITADINWWGGGDQDGNFS